MIELRWYQSDNKPCTLQYRQMVNTTVYAGMHTEEQKLATASYAWTEWKDVPEVRGE